MATNGKYLNISIQPSKVPRTSKTLLELPRDNLTETELVAKSTSDRTKRRVAHVARYPRPVITRPIAPAKLVAQPKPKKLNVLRKCFSSINPCKVRQINETVALDSRAQHSKSKTSGVDNSVNVNKKKLAELKCDQIKAKEKKKSSKNQLNNKDTEHGNKSCPFKGENTLQEHLYGQNNIDLDENFEEILFSELNFPLENLSSTDILNYFEDLNMSNGVDNGVKTADRKTEESVHGEENTNENDDDNVIQIKNNDVKNENKPLPLKGDNSSNKYLYNQIELDQHFEQILFSELNFPLEYLFSTDILNYFEDLNKNYGVDNCVNVNKKKLGKLECDKVKAKEKKKSSKKQLNINDLEHRNKSCPFKGVDNGVNVNKRKLGELECDKVETIKKKKSNREQTNFQDIEHGKKFRPFKDVEGVVTVHKRKSLELEYGKEIKMKKHKSNVDKTSFEVVQGKKFGHLKPKVDTKRN